MHEGPRDRLYRRGVSTLADGELLELLVGTHPRASARASAGANDHADARATARANARGKPRATPGADDRAEARAADRGNARPGARADDHAENCAADRADGRACDSSDARATRSSLAELARASPHELATIAGIGRASAARLAAAFELGRRAVELAQHRTFVRTPQDVLALLGPRVAGLRQELFFAIGLDVRHRVLDIVEVARGTVTDVAVHPREVFRPLVRIAAAGAVLAHNHPSGDPLPSVDDIELTRRLCAVGKIVGIPVLDHVVIGGNEMRSIAECVGDL